MTNQETLTATLQDSIDSKPTNVRRSRPQPIQAGPMSLEAIDAVLSDIKTRGAELVSTRFIAGLNVLLNTTENAEPSLITLGRFCDTVLNKGTFQDNDFEALLQALVGEPLSNARTVTEPAIVGDGGAIITPAVEKTVENTRQKRLAHALYSVRYPSVWSTLIAGKDQTRAEKRIENALARYRATVSEVLARQDIAKQQNAKAESDLLALIMPEPDSDVQETVKEEKAKKAALPKTAQAIFTMLVEGSAKQLTGPSIFTFRATLKAIFRANGFDADTLKKWHDDYMQGSTRAKIAPHRDSELALAATVAMAQAPKEPVETK